MTTLYSAVVKSRVLMGFIFIGFYHVWNTIDISHLYIVVTVIWRLITYVKLSY
jgi:hypothetical protein